MRSKLTVALAALAGAVLAGSCSTPPDRLTLDGRILTVFNDSGEAWKGVEIWVNNHYRVTREAIAANERFQVPLDSFAAGFGQRFPTNQAVAGIEVTATDESGDPVRLVYGSGRRR